MRRRPLSGILSFLFAFFPLRLFAYVFLSNPHQHLPILIYGESLRFDEFDFEIFKVFVIEGEAPLQRSIRDAALLLQEFRYLREDFIKRAHEVVDSLSWIKS